MTDPLPGKPVSSGRWKNIRDSHRLAGFDTGFVLDWVWDTGAYWIWEWEPTAPDPLVGPVKEGTSELLAKSNVVAMNNGKGLVWNRDTGRHAVVDVGDKGVSDPRTGVSDPDWGGTWGTIVGADRQLYRGHSIRGPAVDSPGTGQSVLEVTSSGDYRLYRFEPNLPDDPLPGAPARKGHWDTIGSGHQLLPVWGTDGSPQVLDLAPGHDFRIWSWEERAGLGKDDPLADPAVGSGTWETIRGNQHTLVALGKSSEVFVLDWIPPTGEYWVWRYNFNEAEAAVNEALGGFGRIFGLG